MLFQGKNDAFLRNTANKHRVINVILTELKKPGLNPFYLYNGTDTVITKVKCSKFLEMFYNLCFKDLLMLLLYHPDHNSKPLHFKGNKK